MFLFTTLLFFLNLERDGFWHVRTTTHEQILLLPVTILFSGALGLLLMPYLSDWKALALTNIVSSRRFFTTILLGFLVMSAGLFMLSAWYYAKFGYKLHLGATLLVFTLALAGVAVHLRQREPLLGPTLITVVLGAYTAVSLLSLWSFPLAVGRSDMLPLLAAANADLLTGHNPYHLYHLTPTSSVFLTYLPGTLLAFLPAFLLHIDPRFANLFYVLLLAMMVYRAVAPSHRREAATLLGLLLLSPYLLYRHEIYVEPHWLSLIASLLIASRGRLASAAIVFGISISLSQFSWILFPFFLNHLLQRYGLAAALQAAALSLTVAACITLPFILSSPHAFVYGVLSHWQTIVVIPRPINFSFFAAKLVGPSHLQVIQALFIAAVLLYCLVTGSCRSLTSCLRWMAVVLAGFILLNILVWGYFFLLLEWLLLLYILSANGWLPFADELSPPHPATLVDSHVYR